MNKNDIYGTPQSNLIMASQQNGSPAKAIIITSALNIIGMFLTSALVLFVFAALLPPIRLNFTEILYKTQNLDISDFSIASLTSSFLEYLITIYSSYLCAKIAHSKNYKVVSIFAIIIVGFGLIIGIFSHSLLANLVYASITLISIYFGGWLYVRKT